jgi:hypothetical protein
MPPRTPPRPWPRRHFAVALAVCLLLLAAWAQRDAGAGHGQFHAWIGGGEAGKQRAAEIVVFNTSGFPIPLDLRIRDSEGVVIVERLGELSVGPQQTVFVDVQAELTRDLARKEKPYQGLFSVELTGPAPFGPDDVVVHLAQYFGKRKNPKAAFVVRALFKT